MCLTMSPVCGNKEFVIVFYIETSLSFLKNIKDRAPIPDSSFCIACQNK